MEKKERNTMLCKVDTAKIADTVKELVTILGVRGLKRKTGIAGSSAYNYMDQAQIPNMENIQAISLESGRPIIWFFEGYDQFVSEAMPVSSSPLSSDETHLLSQIRDIDHAGHMAEVIGYIDYLHQLHVKKPVVDKPKKPALTVLRDTEYIHEDGGNDKGGNGGNST